MNDFIITAHEVPGGDYDMRLWTRGAFSPTHEGVLKGEFTASREQWSEVLEALCRIMPERMLEAMRQAAEPENG
jgi:hypothetical protein